MIHEHYCGCVTDGSVPVRYCLDARELMAERDRACVCMGAEDALVYDLAYSNELQKHWADNGERLHD